MASQQRTADYIVDQAAAAGAVSAKKIFGEYGLFCDGKMVALVCGDQLFIKPTDAGRAYVGDITEGHPYPGAKPCFLIDGGRWEDRDWLAELFRITARGLPASKPRKKVTAR